MVLCISVFTYSIVFYERSLTRLNQVSKDRQEMIDELSNYAYALNSNISTLSGQLSLQLRREQNLSGQFLDMKLKKESLDEENTGLKIDLNETKTDLIDSRLEINDLKRSLAILQTDYKNLNDAYDVVVDDAGDICSEIQDKVNVTRCDKYG